MTATKTTTTTDELDPTKLPIAPRRGRKDGAWGTPAPKLPPHLMSTKRWAVATPFLSESGLGVRGGLIGNVVGAGVFCFDPWEAYRAGHITGTSMVTIGAVGSGKSGTNKVMACRLIALGRRVMVPNDPKGEWTRVAEAVGGQTIYIGPSRQDRINPLDAGTRPVGMSEDSWNDLKLARRRRLLITVISLLREGARISPAEHTALDVVLRHVCMRSDSPVIPDIYHALIDTPPEIQDQVGTAGIGLSHDLRRMIYGDLSGMFDTHSTVTPDPEAPMITVNTRDLLHSGDVVQAIASACTGAWSDAIIQAGGNDFWVMFYEEGWAALRDPKMVTSMDERIRLAGELGIATVLILHEIKDLDMVGDLGSSQRNQALGLLSKAQVKIIHRQSIESLPQTAAVLGLSDDEQAVARSLRQGQALWKIGEGSFHVQTTWAPGEHAVFSTDAKRAG